jgi:lipopolysaccharide transport system permease protein
METIVSAEISPNRAVVSTQVVQPTVVIEANRSWWKLDLYELWKHHELLYTLAWRDIRARYAQSVIGLGWAIISPLITISIMTVVFSYWAKIPSDGLPYPLFAYTALLPWGLFAKSLDRASTSLANEGNLITKVYFPRLLIPISATIGGLIDVAVGLAVVAAMILWYGIVPTWGILVLPFFLVLTLATALAVSLWFAALHVRYRDIGAITPLLTQIWMYGSPVVYPVSIVPEEWRIVYGLNPMVGVIEGFRWALLGKASPDLPLMLVSTVIVLIVLLGGLVYFKKMEQTFADVI